MHFNCKYGFVKIYFKKINLSLNDLIETLKNAVGDKGNLIFYSFFWDFLNQTI